MIHYNNDKALNAFSPVRVLSAKDLYLKCGERICRDKGDFTGYGRNPLERMDAALENARNIVTQEEYEEYAKHVAELDETSKPDNDDNSE